MRILTLILTLYFASTFHVSGQCRQNSIGPKEIEYVSSRHGKSLYYDYPDLIFINNSSCIDRSLIKSIKVTAKSNCTVERIIPSYPATSFLDTSTYRVFITNFAACEVLVTINDTLTKIFQFYPKPMPPPHVDVNQQEISFKNILAETNVIGDQSCGIIYWTPLKYSICIIYNGKMFYSGQNIGEKIKPEIKQAIFKAPKNSFILFYDIEVESKESICFKKLRHKFDEYATTKKY